MRKTLFDISSDFECSVKSLETSLVKRAYFENLREVWDRLLLLELLHLDRVESFDLDEGW